MKTLIYTTAIVVLSISMAFTQANNQIIVQLHPNNEVKDLTKNYQFYKGQNIGLYSKRLISKQLNIWLLEFNEKKANARDLLTKIKTSQAVRAAQLNYPVQNRLIPNDAQYASQWQYDNDGLEDRLSDADIDAPLAWDITTGGTTVTGEEIVVAVIDSGVDLTHPDLINNLWTNPHEIPNNGEDDDKNGYIDDIHGWNFDPPFNNNDIGNGGAGARGGHGTSVMGIIGAEGNNGIGVAGVNWNVKVMNFVYRDDASVFAAYAYILDMRTRYNQSNGADGAFIVTTNASIGRPLKGNNDDVIWCSMYDALGEAGIINVAATANDHINVDVVGDIPSGCTSEYLITVTNTDSKDRKIYGSGYGLLSVDLSAPGHGTITTVEDPIGIGTFFGTSAATPHVAGTAALLYSAPIPQFMNDVRQNPPEAALKIKNFILQGVDWLPDLQDITVTGGRLNIYNSLINMQEYYDIEEEPLPKETVFISTISPNPTTDIAEVQIKLYQSTYLTLKVFNGFGQQVHKQSYGKLDRGTHRKNISLYGLPKGIYFVTAVADSFGAVGAGKIIVE